MICSNYFTLLEDEKIYRHIDCVADSQIDPDTRQKNILCSKLIPLQSLYCLGRNI